MALNNFTIHLMPIISVYIAEKPIYEHQLTIKCGMRFMEKKRRQFTAYHHSQLSFFHILRVLMKLIEIMGLFDFYRFYDLKRHVHRPIWYQNCSLDYHNINIKFNFSSRFMCSICFMIWHWHYFFVWSDSTGK